MKREKANGLIYSDSSQSVYIKAASKGEVQATPYVPKQTLMRKTVPENRVKSQMGHYRLTRLIACCCQADLADVH